MTFVQLKTRNHVIDFMKFLAAVLITNSHMGMLYPEKFRFLSTGGAIGDALFFFCSGYLLMMGKSSDFFNWYKKRVNRIFPTIFAIAIIPLLLWGGNPTLKDDILLGGGWFVHAIFVFYAIFWFVKRYFSNKMWIAYVITIIPLLICFFVLWDKSVSIIATDNYLRWPCFFLIMLMGGSVFNIEQKQEKEHKEHNLMLSFCILLVLLLLYYGVQWLEGIFPILSWFQILFFFPLMGIVLQLYKICSSQMVLRFYLNKYCYWLLYYISICCLEVCLCQWWSFGIGIRLIEWFPLNVVITFCLIFIVAYLTKVLSNFLSQTFKSEEYDWGKMMKL